MTTGPHPIPLHEIPFPNMNAPLRTPLARLLGPHSEMPLAIAAGAALAVGYPLWSWTPEPTATVGHFLVYLSLALGSVHGVIAAWTALRALKPDIDVLMVVGAYLSAFIGHPEEGALLLFMFTLAGALEHRAMNRAKDAVSRLHRLMPKNAMIRRGSSWEPTDPETLGAGDQVLVRPGETIPADGIVLRGRSSVDQSSLTGESLPRSVDEGEKVFAGTLNVEGALEVEVLRPVASSSISRILQLVLEAQETRQPIQRLIDRFSTPYTIAVFAMALGAFLWFLFSPARLPISEAAYRAITLLVVASPCALVIATPTATLCGLSRAARSGVLIKGGEALERLARITTVALDKTGTLTTGQIEVTRLEPIAASNVDSLLRIALAAEIRSSHPIAAAIVRMAQSHAVHPSEIASLTNVPGRGVEGEHDGSPVRIGTYEFCEPLVPVCFRAHTRQMVERIRADGGIPVVVAHQGESLVLALSDRPREGAEELASDLRGVGVTNVAMLTGDHIEAARHVAQAVGITDVKAGLLPEQKVDEVRRLKSQTRRGGLAVVGDGVNDAPALAVADIGLAMGGIGADAALETADVVLLHDDLDRIPWTIALAKRVHAIMRANLIFATSVIAVLAALTLLGDVRLSLGVLGHEGSTLLVVANSLRILLHRNP
jgi:Zn2+/Cd2+-exporting ATPase